MPYRRLPNTDAARLKALNTALEKGKNLPPQNLAFKSKILPLLEKTLHSFELTTHQYHQALIKQNKKNQNYFEIMRKARTYLTHFVRVMNMAIIRGELPAEARTYYGLSLDDGNVPALHTENEIISWGKRIIEGEEFRIRKGGNPVSNPTIATVKVRFQSFLDSCATHRILENKTRDLMEKTIILRQEADQIIVRLWNETEETHKFLPDIERRRINESYGIKYFYRKSEPNPSK